MSNVIMCDQCGRIFSQNETGWQHLTGTTITIGSTRPQEMVHDVCVTCVQSNNAKPQKILSTRSTIVDNDEDIIP